MANQATVAAAKADVAQAELAAKLAEPTVTDIIAYMELCVEAAQADKNWGAVSKLAGEITKLQAKQATDQLQAKRGALASAADKLSARIRTDVYEILSEAELELADGVFFSWDMAEPIETLTVRLVKLPVKQASASANGNRNVAGANGPATSKLLIAYGHVPSRHKDLGLSYNELYAQREELSSSKVGNFVHFAIRVPLLKEWQLDGSPNLS